MKNKRLQSIASLVESDALVADIGCDHGYLAIFLKKIKKCPFVIASDVNKNALKVAKNNIQKEKLTKDIPCILSNGMENLPIEKLDTIIIAGMGTHTILDILNNPNAQKIKTFILQSNNDYELLRKEMNKKNYKIVDEVYVEEKGHHYFIIKYQIGNQKLSELEFKYGLYKKENEKYYEKIWKDKKRIHKKIPWYQWKKRKAVKKEIHALKKYKKGPIK